MRTFGVRTGLLLGAGFSQPAGMPLVRELTSLLFLKAYLRLKKDAPRCLLSDRGLKRFAEVLTGLSPATNYEAFVGLLEDECLSALDKGLLDQAMIAIAERFGFLELISEVMLECEEQAQAVTALTVPLFQGLRELASQSHPLWVFSLNHDLVLEKLAASWRIPVATPVFQLHPPSRIRTLLARVRAQHLSPCNLVFQRLSDSAVPLKLFEEGRSGINLVKLHGSLNQFIDITDVSEPRIVQFSPPLVRRGWDTLHTLLQNMRSEDSTSAALNHWHMNLGETRLRVRNTILSGSHKFTEHSGILNNPVVAPLAHVVKHAKGSTIAYEMAEDYKTTLGDDFLGSQFRIFSDSIHQLTRLVTIGYSLGDAHVNSVMRDWLASDLGRTLEIVGPAAPQLASRLAPGFSEFVGAGRVEFTDADTLTYFSRYSDVPQRERDAHAALLAALVARRTKRAEVAAKVAREVADHVDRTDDEQIRHWLDHGATYDFNDLHRMVDAGMSFPKPPDNPG